MPRKMITVCGVEVKAHVWSGAAPGLTAIGTVAEISRPAFKAIAKACGHKPPRVGQALVVAPGRHLVNLGGTFKLVSDKVGDDFT